MDHQARVQKQGRKYFAVGRYDAASTAKLANAASKKRLKIGAFFGRKLGELRRYVSSLRITASRQTSARGIRDLERAMALMCSMTCMTPRKYTGDELPSFISSEDTTTVKKSDVAKPLDKWAKAPPADPDMDMYASACGTNDLETKRAIAIIIACCLPSFMVFGPLACASGG